MQICAYYNVVFSANRTIHFSQSIEEGDEGKGESETIGKTFLEYLLARKITELSLENNRLSPSEDKVVAAAAAAAYSSITSTERNFLPP